ncbi:isocitrate lyase/phosphoenolpyruvate mutase family protein [Parvibaculaceae bacterium PLY_AMNH_Bact1]|nr:isocitrate lyase/phosphoenolpyruvate mutase family protein [Parvibaculaceae bacterium PLY_AMNH_Bact1]
MTTRFMDLHTGAKGFIMPNAWDPGTARLLEAEGFPAIGSTSAGIAFSLGKQDYNVSDPTRSVQKDEMFACLRKIAEAVSIPVNGDLEAGYGDAPDAVANTIGLAIATGLAGGNIEDKKPYADELYEEELAVERIAAAAATIRASGTSFVLTARTDAYRPYLADTLETVIRRANRFLEAGATCIFAPGIDDLPTIKTLVKEVAGPINIVAGLYTPDGNAHDMIKAGAQRISLGGSIARSTLGYIKQCAERLRDDGDFNFPAPQISQDDLNDLFA